MYKSTVLLKHCYMKTFRHTMVSKVKIKYRKRSTLFRRLKCHRVFKQYYNVYYMVHIAVSFGITALTLGLIILL